MRESVRIARAELLAELETVKADAAGLWAELGARCDRAGTSSRRVFPSAPPGPILG